MSLLHSVFAVVLYECIYFLFVSCTTTRQSMFSSCSLIDFLFRRKSFMSLARVWACINETCMCWWDLCQVKKVLPSEIMESPLGQRYNVCLTTFSCECANYFTTFTLCIPTKFRRLACSVDCHVKLETGCDEIFTCNLTEIFANS